MTKMTIDRSFFPDICADIDIGKYASNFGIKSVSVQVRGEFKKEVSLSIIAIDKNFDSSRPVK